MNAKQTAPLIVTLPAIAAAAPPLIIGGAIFVGAVYLLEWLMSDDDKEKKPESVPASTTPALAARPALVIPSNSGGKSNVTPAPSEPSVSASAIVRASSAFVLPPPPSIPAVKTAPQIPLPTQKKFIARKDMAKVFNGGARALTRTAAVAALKSLGFGKTAAYDALLENGRFSAWLQFAPDGIIAWKG